MQNHAHAFIIWPMKNAKIAILLAGLVLFLSMSIFNSAAAQSQPTGYDLAAAVNAYRAANGYYQLSYNSLVASAAQAHAEWIVETGQGGHIGSGGSDETVRVSWTGYGGGATILCDECWASGTSVDYAVYSAWSDWVHQEVMLNAWGNLYTDIGGGVASQGDGRYVFILNVCKVVGQEYDGTNTGSGSNPAGEGDSEALATADYSNYIYGVTTATPQADGTVTHTVLYGQTLASIAEAYGVTIEQLRELNGMAATDSTIWVDQELIIQAGTGAASTNTDANATATVDAQSGAEAGADEETAPTPTSAPPTQTPPPTQGPTATPVVVETGQGAGLLTRNLGLILVVVCGGGLAVYLFVSSRMK